MNREIYLDNSATTRQFDEVTAYMSHIAGNVYGNPSSLHRKGIEAEKHLKKARQAVADSLKVESRDLYFTSGGTEANNLAILGCLEANPRLGRHIITTQVEHPSVLEVFRFLEKKGYKTDFIKVDSFGTIDLDELESKISPETALISIILVNNEIGTVQPVEEIIRIKNSIKRDALIHVDAVQAYCKIPVFPQRAGIDFLSVSSHKIHGPKGVGALYAKRGVKISPVFYGGGQETALRSGTENVPGICGFGMASEMISGSIDENHKKVKTIKEAFIKRLGNLSEDFKMISPGASLPYILNIAFAGLKAEVLLHHLEEFNIFVSTGSACSSRKNTHSHVLKAVKLDSKYIEGAIRFSFSALNSVAEAEETVEALKVIIPKIKIKRGGQAWKK